MYMLKKDYDHAIDYYREAHERFPEGSRAAYAHWKAAWLTYRQGRTEEAKKEFTQHVRSYPASLETAAAVYWRGRIAEDRERFAPGPGVVCEGRGTLPQLLLRPPGGGEAGKNRGFAHSARSASRHHCPAVATERSRGADQRTGGHFARGEEQASGKRRDDRLCHQGIAGIRRRQRSELGNAGNRPHL